MKKKKYKLKKDVYLYIFSLIILILIGKYALDYYKEYKYKKTYEYKLIQTGYTKDEIKIFDKYYSDEEMFELAKNDENPNLIKFMKSKYYIHKNLDQYLEYLNLNSDNNIDEIVTKVNTHRNYEYYEQNIKTNEKDNYKILVNKYYYLGEDYEPDDLVTISTKYSWGEYGSKKIRKEAYDMYIKMHEAANENGIYLMVNSAYRNYKDQLRVYNNYKTSQGQDYADKIAARAGYSEHQTGLALDIFSIDNSSQKNFKDSKAYEWLKDNSYKYGFILRYPEGKEDITGYNFESWHYRYVGTDLAKDVYEKDITYDEYYAYYIENKNS